MKKIKYVSLGFRILFQLAVVALVILQVRGWLRAPEINIFYNVIPGFYRPLVQHNLDLNTKIAGFFITAVPTLMKLILLISLIKLFRLYEQYQFFSKKNVQYMRRVGYVLLTLQFVNPISEFLLGFVLTSINPPEFRLARFAIYDTNIGLILTALIIILISWIMLEGCKLHDEQQLTI